MDINYRILRLLYTVLLRHRKEDRREKDNKLEKVTVNAALPIESAHLDVIATYFPFRINPFYRCRLTELFLSFVYVSLCTKC